MKRVAIFGNVGGGKSTLARELADITGLPLQALDKLHGELPYEEYLQAHTRLVGRDEWIMEGFGCIKSVWQTLEAADTLVHVDLPLAVHVLWVTKRLVKGLFVTPEGWPENGPIIRGSMLPAALALPQPPDTEIPVVRVRSGATEAGFSFTL